jgi:DNA-directed RNA polymerase specialized sigma24 family protein
MSATREQFLEAVELHHAVLVSFAIGRLRSCGLRDVRARLLSERPRDTSGKPLEWLDAVRLEAEEQVGATVADILIKGSYTRCQGDVVPWLKGSIRNKVRDWARWRGRERRRSVPVVGEHAHDPVDPESQFLEDLVIERADYPALQVAVRDALNAVPDPDVRKAFDRHFFDDVPVERVAAELGYTARALRRAMHGEYDMLRKRLYRFRDWRGHAW